MTEKSEYQKERISRYATQQGITVTEYKKRYDERTAQNKGLSLKEYSKKRREDAAKAKGMTLAEYSRDCAERYAKKKGFRNKKEYDVAYKRAKVLHVSLDTYCSSLKKYENGCYVVPELKKKSELRKKMELEKEG